jgi:trimeric autotransporter adhesin
MPFIGNKPSAIPLTSADLADSIITSAKIVDGTIVNADINASAAIAGTKLTGAGKVLQVVTATDSTQRSTTSTSFVTASNTLSVSITPSSSF